MSVSTRNRMSSSCLVINSVISSSLFVRPLRMFQHPVFSSNCWVGSGCFVPEIGSSEVAEVVGFEFEMNVASSSSSPFGQTFFLWQSPKVAESLEM